jgi:hypothetical protein
VVSRRTYNERRAYSARVMRFRQAVYLDREPVKMVDVHKGKPVEFTMTNGCRLLLLRLSDDMDANGNVSIPRSELAAHLGTAPARITEWVHAAQRLGFLAQVRRGRPGVTAVYRGLVPSAEEVREGVPSERYARADHAVVREGVPPEATAWYATHPSQEVVAAATTETAPIRDHRNVSRDEQGAAAPVVDGLRRGATGDREASA